MSRQIRRRSMPAAAAAAAALPSTVVPGRNDSGVATPGPLQLRPRAKTFSASPVLALSGSIEELTGHTEQALAEIALASAQARVSMQSRTNRGMQGSTETLAVTPYTQNGLLSLQIPPWNPSMQEQDVIPRSLATIRPDPLLISQSTRTDQQEVDTRILLTVVDRGLIPAERLDPYQCQQVLVAQQRARYRRYRRASGQSSASRYTPQVPQLNAQWYDRDLNKADPSRSQLSWYHRDSQHHCDYSLATTSNPCTLSLRNQKGVSSQDQRTLSQQDRRKRHERSTWCLNDTSRPMRQYYHHQDAKQYSRQQSLYPSPAASLFSFSKGSAWASNRQASHDSLGPAPLQPRLRPEKRRSIFDPQKDAERRAQWVSDNTRDQQARAASKQQADDHYAQHVKAHREMNRLRTQLQDERDAEQRAGDERIRHQGLHFFYKAYINNLRGGGGS